MDDRGDRVRNTSRIASPRRALRGLARAFVVCGPFRGGFAQRLRLEQRRRRADSVVQGILQSLGGLELRRPRGGNRDGLAGARITALARLAVGDVERAEAMNSGFATGA